MTYLGINTRDKKYHLEGADEVAPRKRLTSPLKLVLDLMAGICENFRKARIRNRFLLEGVRILGVGGNWSARGKPTKAGMESANKFT